MYRAHRPNKLIMEEGAVYCNLLKEVKIPFSEPFHTTFSAFVATGYRLRTESINKLYSTLQRII